MSNLIKKANPKNYFSFPHWLEDFDDSMSQRRLKVHETEKDIVVEAVVAGVSSEDIEVNIEDGVVTIKAEKKQEKESQRAYSVSRYSYYYTTALSGGKWDEAKAEVEDGILTLEIPKLESTRPQRIQVKSKK